MHPTTYMTLYIHVHVRVYMGLQIICTVSCTSCADFLGLGMTSMNFLATAKESMRHDHIHVAYPGPE